MCGIFGIVGAERASQITLDALQRMEYRGYDSAGLATIAQGSFFVKRAPGKIDALTAKMHGQPLPGKVAIGHTRWATHGAATERNAHPHVYGEVAVVHNGIIENHEALMEELRMEGYAPTSETDSEVIAMMVEQGLRAGLPPQRAVFHALDRLDGSYATAVLILSSPDYIYAGRKGSPLAIGFGEGFNVLGSDAVSIGPVTRRIAYLTDGDMAIISPEDIRLFDWTGEPVIPVIQTLEPEEAAASREGYAHFMAKEMHEQPQVVTRILSARLDPAGNLAGDIAALDLRGAKRIRMVACGTSYYACMLARYWIEELTSLPVSVDIASEALSHPHHAASGDVVIFVSQSGETADSLAALQRFKANGARIISLVNAPNSTMARLSDAVLPLQAGAEIGVASTKAFTAQILTLALLALRAAEQSGQTSTEAARQDLSTLPSALHAVLAIEPEIIAVARQMAAARSAFFIGRGTSFPIACEGALKLKEITYIHAEGLAAGELKHGPIALIDPSMPSVVLSSQGSGHHEKTLSSAAEIAARGGPIHLFSDGDAPASLPLASHTKLPAVSAMMTPFVQAVAMQFLAYHSCLALGHDPDRPRNLAKSVTVA